ncbi:MAG: carboxypeptidase regulatory-like domain-containing protein [Planctomycetes bacterium]|nr:carboxypeptidase regulatory-like domain-containing protein [Planctomycetota bacterium]
MSTIKVRILFLILVPFFSSALVCGQDIHKNKNKEEIVKISDSHDIKKDEENKEIDKGIEISIKVVGSDTLPIGRADVIVKRKVDGGFLKINKTTTSSKGEVVFSDVPIGDVMIIVIKKSYHTFSDVYSVSKNQNKIKIQLDTHSDQISDNQTSDESE